jgi:hypothetical protein
MAIITIPSSIAGITIPGGLVSGPLSALFGKPFGQNNLQYPRDLQSATKGHVIHFTVKEVEPLKYDETLEKSLNLIQNPSVAADKLVSAVKEFKDSSGLNFQPKREKIAGNIFLYMPDTMNFQYNVTYDDTISALGAAGKFVEKLFGKNKGGNAVTSLVSAGVSSNGVALLGQKAGYAVNPQLQMLFQGIGFREYQMAFTFTPYSKQEAKAVDDIIKMFRTHAAPRIITGAGGMFLIPPAAFKLDFLFNGNQNKHMSRVADSVITNIDVNYSPNGWAAYDDGSPVQTTLTLQFKEISLIDRNKIEIEGY